MNKLQKIMGMGIIALGLTSCMPPKLEYSGIINGNDVKYYENLVRDGDDIDPNTCYDTWSNYKIDVTKKDGTQIEYLCRSSKGELILFEKQVNDGKTIRDYHKGEVLSTSEIKSGQAEVNDYINKIRESK